MISSKKHAKEQILKIAQEYDIDLAELLEEEYTRQDTPVYRNPRNQFKVWYGRGRKPNWLNSLLEQGYTLDDLKIN